MAHRTLLICLVWLVLPAAALARPADAPKLISPPIPVDMTTSAIDIGLPPAPAVSTAAAAKSFDRAAIFHVLCGGEKPENDALRAHLWRVAGSLAARGWTPPRVTVRIVVAPVGP